MSIIKKITVITSIVCLIATMACSVFAESVPTTMSDASIESQSIVSPNYISTHQPQLGFSGTVWCTAKPYANLRKGPGTNYATWPDAQFNYGASCYIEGVTTNGWGYWTTILGNTIYCDARYLSTVPVN